MSKLFEELDKINRELGKLGYKVEIVLQPVKSEARIGWRIPEGQDKK
jgi:hypothetical protein